MFFLLPERIRCAVILSSSLLTLCFVHVIIILCAHSKYNYISFVNEAAKCVEDEIIEDFVAGDIGLVFGTGFAPFRGGPFRYLDQVGVANYADMMNGFADKYGPQFEPCQLIKDYAASGKKFHR